LFDYEVYFVLRNPGDVFTAKLKSTVGSHY